jgi:hypothetical protein
LDIVVDLRNDAESLKRITDRRTAALPHCRTAALPHCRTAALQYSMPTRLTVASFANVVGPDVRGRRH